MNVLISKIEKGKPFLKKFLEIFILGQLGTVLLPVCPLFCFQAYFY